MEWLRQISQAIDYIENNLDGEISYDEAARIACCSTYYFQRMFSYIAGISLSEYIRRRRMTRAAFELQTSETKVIDIGSKYGYVSPTSFNRAFQNVHSVAPTMARIEGTKLSAYPRISFHVNVIGGENIMYRVEKKDPIKIAGVKVELTEDISQNFEIVPQFWDNVLKSNSLKKIKELSNKEPYGILGVSVYKGPDEIYYYIASSTDKSVPEDLEEYEIPATTWVIFENDGHFPDSIQTVFKKFLTEWLPFSGYEYAELPDIEVYSTTDEKLKRGHAEVWIAVRKSK